MVLWSLQLKALGASEESFGTILSVLKNFFKKKYATMVSIAVIITIPIAVKVLWKYFYRIKSLKEKPISKFLPQIPIVFHTWAQRIWWNSFHCRCGGWHFLTGVIFLFSNNFTLLPSKSIKLINVWISRIYKRWFLTFMALWEHFEDPKINAYEKERNRNWS